MAVLDGGRAIAVANYGTGQVAVYTAPGRGGLSSEPTSLVTPRGGSRAHPERQDGPHAHAVAADPVTGEVLVADLGQDTVLRHTLAQGTLAEAGRIVLRPGDGPRALAFHPDGRHLFIVNELANTVTTCRRDRGKAYAPVGAIGTLPPGWHGHSEAGALRLDRAGQQLYVTNRGHDSITVFRFDSGTLAPIQNLPTLGAATRELVLDPEERYVLVANQNADEIVARPRLADGTLGEVSGRYSCPTPVCIVFDQAT